MDEEIMRLRRWLAGQLFSRSEEELTVEMELAIAQYITARMMQYAGEQLEAMRGS